MVGATRVRQQLRPTPAAPARAPTITATLTDGPLTGHSIETDVVEGRPPKVIDLAVENASCRYCLAHWAQSGPSALYTFLYRVERRPAE